MINFQGNLYEQIQWKNCPMAAAGEERTADEQDGVHQGKVHLRGEATN